MSDFHNSPLSGTTRVGRYLKKHSPTHTHSGLQTSFISFLRILRFIAFSLFNLWLDSPFPQPHSRSSLVCFLVWNLLHTPYIFHPSHYLLSTTHAHTITTFFYCRTKIMSSIRNLFLSLSVLDKGALNGCVCVCVCVCVYVYVCVWVVVYVVVVRRGRRRGQARD